MSQNISLLPAPVINIGIVGHRLNRLSREPDVVRSELRDILSQIKRHFSNGFKFEHHQVEPVSFRCLTGLADGADQLGAEAALSLGYELYCLAVDSASAQAMHDFNPTLCVSIDFRKNDDTCGYLALSEVLLARSDLLIVVWDEGPSGGGGGTTEVVVDARRRGIPIVWVHAVDDREPLMSTTESQQKDGWIDFDVLELYRQIRPMVFPNYQGEDLIELQRYLQAHEGNWKWSTTNWLWNVLFQLDRKFRKSPTQRDLESKYGFDKEVNQLNSFFDVKRNFADQMANNMALRYRGSTTLMYLGSAVSVTFGVIGSLFYTDSTNVFEMPLFSVLEVLLILWIIGMFVIGKRHRWHGLWLQSRYLAEQLRVHRALFPILGITSFMLEKHSEKHPNWANWLYRRYAAQVPLPVFEPNVMNTEFILNYKEWAIDALNEQIAWHHNKALTERHRVVLMQRIGMILFFLTALAAGAQLVLREPAEITSILTVIAVAFPAFAAATHAIITQEESEKLAAKSRDMARVLEACRDSLVATEDCAAVRMIITEAAELMAEEAQDWRRLIGSKPMNLPH